jgi:hypothetical protein
VTRIRIASPVGAVAARVQTLAALPESLRGLRIAVLDNRKPNAQLLLQGIATGVARDAGMDVGVVTSKNNAAEPAAGEVLEKLRLSADVVITGSGD